MSTSKRVFFYAVSIIGLGVFAGGISNLLRLPFDLTIRANSPDIGGPEFYRDQFSMGLAMLVIGGLLWFFFWRAIQKQTATDAGESATTVRKLYLNVILLASSLTFFISSIMFLQWLLSGVPSLSFPGGGTAALMVGAVIWVYHWHIEEKEGQPSLAAKTLRRWYLYILSAWGLIWFSFSLVQLIRTAVLYLPVWGDAINSDSFWSSSVQGNIAAILAGGLAWVFHWFFLARADHGSTLRNVYLYLLTIFGGAVAALVALTTFVFQILRFYITNPATADARYFQFMGWTVPTMLVAGGIWAYHQQKALEEAASGSTQHFSARRVLLYLMSFIGLGILTAGIVMLIGILLDAWINAVSSGPVIVEPGWWHNQLALSLAFLIVAAPVWYYYWNRVIRTVESGGIAEWRARSRRIFLYFILGAAIVALTAAMVNIIYQIINGVLQGTFGVDTLNHSKWSLQILIAATPVLVYHLSVLRQDQHRGAEGLIQQKAVTALIGEESLELIHRIEHELGYAVHLLITSSEPGVKASFVLSDEEIKEIADNIHKSDAKKVMLVSAQDKFLVLPYKEK